MNKTSIPLSIQSANDYLGEAVEAMNLALERIEQYESEDCVYPGSRLERALTQVVSAQRILEEMLRVGKNASH